MRLRAAAEGSDGRRRPQSQRAAGVAGYDASVDPGRAGQRGHLFEEHLRCKLESEHALRASLAADEQPVAMTVRAWGGASMVTDRRFAFAPPGRRGSPSTESFPFDRIDAWHLGWMHDERPFVVLRHPPRMCVEWVPAHRFLWFRWGNATAPVPRAETRVSFPRKRDPVFLALVGELRRLAIAEEPTRIERPAGTREERIGGSVNMYRLMRYPRLHALRWGRGEVVDTLYSGSLAWQLRLFFWLVLGGLAAVVSPWVVVPALVLTGMGLMVAMQLTGPLGRRRIAGLTILVAVASLAAFALAASLGPEKVIVCGTGGRLDRVTQVLTQALGAGHIDGATASWCTLPSAAAWAVADLAFLVAAGVGLVLVGAPARRRVRWDGSGGSGHFV